MYLKSPKSNAKSNTKRNTKSNTKGILKRVLKGKLKGFTLRSETIEDLCEKVSTIVKNNTVLKKTAARTLQFRIVFAIGGRLTMDSVHALCVFLCTPSLIAK